MKKSTSITLWIISIIIMVFVVFYQKMTGPTYPIKSDKIIAGLKVNFSLPTSNDGEYTKFVYIYDKSKTLTGTYKIRRFRSHDEWSYKEMLRNGDTLFFEIPHHASAGKVMYQIFLSRNNGKSVALTDKPVILRFRDEVPMVIVVFHLIFIFGTILLSTRAGLEALYEGKHVNIYTILTIIFLIFGGFVFGPLMQKFAFGAYWTGWPFGHDLTDNKTVIAIIFWLIALFVGYRKPDKKRWHIIAAIMLLVVYLIPHSLLGSELDYTKSEQKKIEHINK